MAVAAVVLLVCAYLGVRIVRAWWARENAKLDAFIAAGVAELDLEQWEAEL